MVNDGQKGPVTGGREGFEEREREREREFH